MQNKRSIFVVMKNGRIDKYNGKELVTMHGLNTYDYGARQYDPILCRWDRVDPLCEKNPEISPYAYCNNNPVKYVDPDGKKTYLYATTLPGLNPGPLNPLRNATHTFLVVTNSEGEVQGYYAYGSEYMGVRGAFGGRLMRQQYDQDISVYQGNDTDHLKKKIEVLPPKGMSSEQFDQKVLDVANSFGNQDGIRYFVFPTKQTEGNCNTSTSTILIKSGVSSEQIKDIKDRIPDISTGFSETPRPWTEEEQKAAIEHENVIKEMHSKQGNGPTHP
jgi:RHS repeat-associated protein